MFGFGRGGACTPVGFGGVQGSLELAQPVGERDGVTTAVGVVGAYELAAGPTPLLVVLFAVRDDL